MESPYEDLRGLLRVPNPNPLMLCILETISISVFGTGSRDAGEANSLYTACSMPWLGFVGKHLS